MLHTTPETFDQALAMTETRLLELAERLDCPVPDDTFHRVVLLLGTRARTLFRGFTMLATSTEPVAAMPLVRPMVEVDLTLRFVRANPNLHADIWTAEGELQTLKLIRALNKDEELVAKHGELDMTAEWFTEREAFVAEVRARAIAARVKGVGKAPTSALMPNMQTIATAHGDLSTREAYTLAYRSLNQDSHAGARSFNTGVFSVAGDGQVRFVEITDPENELRGHRTLSATTFASTLTLVAGPLGLDVLYEANALKQVLLTTVVSHEGGEKETADAG